MKTFFKAIGSLTTISGKVLIDGGSRGAGAIVRISDTVNKSDKVYLKRMRTSTGVQVYNHGYDKGYEATGKAVDWVEDAANSAAETWDDLFSKDEETKVPDFMK